MTAANSAAIAHIWQSDFERLARWAKSKLRNPELGEDITMQAFAELGELMERRFLPDPRGMVRSILHRRIVDEIRDAVTRPAVVDISEQTEEGQAILDGIGASRPYLAVDNATFPVDFDQAVRYLPEQDRDAFILTELRGLTVREAADVLGTSKSDVDRRASSARTSIRKELAA